MIGCYPGTFNPATIAHLAIAEAAWQQCGLERVDFMLSGTSLGKEDLSTSTAHQRAEDLRRLVADRPWIGVRVIEAQLLAEIAHGYDVLVMGADKWAQINEPKWYSTPQEQLAALAKLPHLAIAPRPPFEIPQHATKLVIARQLWGVSSTGVRNGRSEWQALRDRMN